MSTEEKWKRLYRNHDKCKKHKCPNCYEGFYEGLPRKTAHKMIVKLAEEKNYNLAELAAVLKTDFDTINAIYKNKLNSRPSREVEMELIKLYCSLKWYKKDG